MNPITEPAEDQPASFRFRLIDQMILVAFLGILLALAKVDLAFGVVGFLLFAPAWLRTIRLLNVQRSRKIPQSLQSIAAEVARSICSVLMSYLFTVAIFLFVAILASIVLNIIFLLIAGIISMIGLPIWSGFSKSGAIRCGLVIGFGGAVVAFLRECIRFWRISDERSVKSRPTTEVVDPLNEVWTG